jgi:hypothetical protein
MGALERPNMTQMDTYIASLTGVYPVSAHRNSRTRRDRDVALLLPLAAGRVRALRLAGLPL